MWYPVLNPLPFPPSPQLDVLCGPPSPNCSVLHLRQMVCPRPARCLWASQLSQTETILTVCSSIFLITSKRVTLSSLPLGSSTEEVSGILHNLLPRLFSSSFLPGGHIPTGKFSICVVMQWPLLSPSLPVSPSETHISMPSPKLVKG